MFTSKKRGREEDGDILQQDAPDTKRSTLPFRTSSYTRHIRPLSQSRSRPSPLFTQTITPADSSEEENSPPFRSTDVACQQHRPTFSIGSTFQGDYSCDSDMDMTDSLPLASPRQWAQFPQTPSPKASPRTMEFRQAEFTQLTQNNVTGGRLPTPIYGHFQRSIDAKIDMDEISESQTSRLPREANHNDHDRHHRRLPTPIDEDEVMEISSAIMSGEMMDLRLSGHHRRGGVDYTYHPQCLGTPENNFTYQSHSDTVACSASHAAPQSRRTSFSMGPRANCELCIRRVPGHSNHIIRT